jgi:hypothetical protein
MKVSDVSKDDCIRAAQLINMLRIAEYKIDGKDICAGADSIRWLQQLAVEMAKVYTPAVNSSEGLSVKSYNPGKRGKT